MKGVLLLYSKEDEKIGFFGSLLPLLRVGFVDMRIHDVHAVAHELHHDAGGDCARGA